MRRCSLGRPASVRQWIDGNQHTTLHNTTAQLPVTVKHTALKAGEQRNKKNISKKSSGHGSRVTGRGGIVESVRHLRSPGPFGLSALQFL